jgi:starch synthase
VNGKPNRISVLFASSEAAPWVKTGGLGDIAGALPGALKDLGVDVRLLLPGYPPVLAAATRRVRLLADVPGAWPFPPFRLVGFNGRRGVPVIAIDCPLLYGRPGGPYQDANHHDWGDNALRFGLLSHVAALLAGPATPLAWRPRVLHCHDWQTGLAPAYLRLAGATGVATLVTIHNLAFQGLFGAEMVGALGLPPSIFHMHGVEFYGHFSFLKAGLYYADAITTVSPTYAREIQAEPLGFGMQGLLATRRDVLHGILNGIDTEAWNPADDPHLACNYDAATLDAKAENRRALQRRLGLAEDDSAPLLGNIGRLTYQKGTDLLLEVGPRLVEAGAQLALLGTGDPPLEVAIRWLASTYPGRVAAFVGFDESLAHLVEAGLDVFLMPSRFEPCGMNQMYSQRYGTPPVAHATGGLVDSIVDATPATLADGTATGFLFRYAGAVELLDTVDRALALRADPAKWRALQLAGMRRDFSWRAAANEYLALYARLAGVPVPVARASRVAATEEGKRRSKGEDSAKGKATGVDKATSKGKGADKGRSKGKGADKAKRISTREDKAKRITTREDKAKRTSVGRREDSAKGSGKGIAGPKAARTHSTKRATDTSAGGTRKAAKSPAPAPARRPRVEPVGASTSGRSTEPDRGGAGDDDSGGKPSS